MSRKGKQPIALPKGVQVQYNAGIVCVKGPKGELQRPLQEGIAIQIEADKVIIGLEPSIKQRNDLHGLYWALVRNMVLGVSTGFEKKLELVGIGYRASVVGTDVELLLGRSHPTKIQIPPGITVKVDKNFVVIQGVDKQVVGQLAAEMRAERPPEPYQGKGIRYDGERVRRKQGKTAAKK